MIVKKRGSYSVKKEGKKNVTFKQSRKLEILPLQRLILSCECNKVATDVLDKTEFLFFENTGINTI